MYLNGVAEIDVLLWNCCLLPISLVHLSFAHATFARVPADCDHTVGRCSGILAITRSAFVLLPASTQVGSILLMKKDANKPGV